LLVPYPWDREAKDPDSLPVPGEPPSPEEPREDKSGDHHLPEKKSFFATLKRTESGEPQFTEETTRKRKDYVTLPMKDQ